MRRLHKGKGNKNGMSLLEVLIAVVIIAIIGNLIIQTLLLTLYYSSINNEKTVAMVHLSDMMERIRSTTSSRLLIDFPNGVANGPTSNRYSNIVGGYTLKNESIVVSYANPSSPVLEAGVTLSWTDRRGATQTSKFATKKSN